MSAFVQLVVRRFEERRAKRGSQPLFEFDLLPNERIVGVKHYYEADHASRETIDRMIDVWVEVRL